VAGRLTLVLCSHGAAVDGVKSNGSPLATALYFANLDCVDALLTVGARAENSVFAAAAGKTDWVHAWLEGDRDDDARSVPGSFPLSSNRKIAAQQALVFASMCGRIKVVRALVGHGVDVDACPPGSHRTGTALHTAAYQGQVEVATFLLKSGADQAIRDARHRGTPLEWTLHAPRRRRGLARPP
jgi:Ankyrin repeats (many copies)